MVRLGITGTPGTGKTTTAKLLSKRLGISLIDLNKIALKFQIDTYKDSKVIDTDPLEEYISANYAGDYIIEGHLLCVMHLPLDFVFVLRTRPEVLKERLILKGWDRDKVNTNVEAEALDYCLINAEQNYENVFQIDTTNRPPKMVVDKIVHILNGRDTSDEIDWSDLFFNTL